MGTRYTLLNNAAHPVDGIVNLDEHSNKFDLVVTYTYADVPDPTSDGTQRTYAEPAKQLPCEATLADLTFADLRTLRDQINTVLSYWDEE